MENSAVTQRRTQTLNDDAPAPPQWGRIVHGFGGDAPVGPQWYRLSREMREHIGSFLVGDRQSLGNLALTSRYNAWVFGPCAAIEFAKCLGDRPMPTRAQSFDKLLDYFVGVPQAPSESPLQAPLQNQAPLRNLLQPALRTHHRGQGMVALAEQLPCLGGQEAERSVARFARLVRGATDLPDRHEAMVLAALGPCIGTLPAPHRSKAFDYVLDESRSLSQGHADVVAGLAVGLMSVPPGPRLAKQFKLLLAESAGLQDAERVVVTSALTGVLAKLSDVDLPECLDALVEANRTLRPVRLQAERLLDMCEVVLDLRVAGSPHTLAVFMTLLNECDDLPLEFQPAVIAGLAVVHGNLDANDAPWPARFDDVVVRHLSGDEQTWQRYRGPIEHKYHACIALLDRCAGFDHKGQACVLEALAGTINRYAFTEWALDLFDEVRRRNGVLDVEHQGETVSELATRIRFLPQEHMLSRIQALLDDNQRLPTAGERRFVLDTLRRHAVAAMEGNLAEQAADLVDTAQAREEARALGA